MTEYAELTPTAWTYERLERKARGGAAWIAAVGFRKPTESDDVRNILPLYAGADRATLLARAEKAEKPRVKALEWDESGCRAKGLGILYAMAEGTPGLFALYSPMHTDEMPQSDIYDLAQADYTARILSALEPSS